jgi:hypothetical protein
MLMSLGFKGRWWLSVAATIAFVMAPAVEATPLGYTFTVNVTTGPLAGVIETGSFSYDSGSVVAGTFIDGPGLLTAFDFTFNGTTYNAAAANTGMLKFDSTGDLTGFRFGTDCDVQGTCYVVWGSDNWIINSGVFGFGYSTPASGLYSRGTVSFTRAAPAPVPEPDSLSLFGAGVLMLGLVASWRRRVF